MANVAFLSTPASDAGSVFDAAYSYSYPTLGPPADEAVIRDIAEISANGRFELGSGKTIGYAGGGFDFSSYTNTGGYRSSYVEAPAAPSAHIWSAGAANHQVFLICLYLRLPLLADWNTGAGILPFVQFANGASGYPAESDLLTMGMNSVNVPGSLTARRQLNGLSSINALTLFPALADYGSVVQLAFWRNDAGQGFRLKSAAGKLLTSAAKGDNNTGDFSAKLMKVGILPSFWSVAPAASVKWRLYRGFIENLRTSGRDPETVLDADWARTMARGVFS